MTKKLYIELSLDNVAADVAKQIVNDHSQIIGVETFGTDTIDPEDDGSIAYSKVKKRADALPSYIKAVQCDAESTIWVGLKQLAKVQPQQMRLDGANCIEKLYSTIRAARPVQPLQVMEYVDLAMIPPLAGVPFFDLLARLDVACVPCYLFYHATNTNYWPHVMVDGPWDDGLGFKARVKRYAQCTGKPILVRTNFCLHEGNGDGHGWERVSAQQHADLIGEVVAMPEVAGLYVWGQDRLIDFYASIPAIDSSGNPDPRYTRWDATLARQARSTWPNKPVGEITMEAIDAIVQAMP